MADPWETSAADVSASMAEQMLNQAEELVQSVANPFGLPYGALTDIAAAFHASMSLLEQGQFAIDRERYRTAAKALHEGDRGLYDSLPDTSYDNSQPYYTLISAAADTVKLYNNDGVSKSEFTSRMGTFRTIFDLIIMPAAEQAHENTPTANWRLDTEVCTTIDGEEKCSQNGDLFYSSVNFSFEIVKALEDF